MCFPSFKFTNWRLCGGGCLTFVLIFLTHKLANPMDACDLCKHVIGGLRQTFVSFLMEHISIRIWYSLMEHIDQEKNVPIYLFTCWPVWGSPAMESCSGHTSAWRWSSSSWCLVCRFVRSSGATSRSTITRSSMRICYSHRCKKPNVKKALAKKSKHYVL